MKQANLGHFDVVELLDGVLEWQLVGLDVHHEDQRVGVLNLLHCRLGGQRVLDDCVGVQLVSLRHSLARVLRVSGLLQRGRSVEVHRGADLLLMSRVLSLDHLLLGIKRLRHGFSVFKLRK